MLGIILFQSHLEIQNSILRMICIYNCIYFEEFLLSVAQLCKLQANRGDVL